MFRILQKNFTPSGITVSNLHIIMKMKTIPSFLLVETMNPFFPEQCQKRYAGRHFIIPELYFLFFLSAQIPFPPYRKKAAAQKSPLGQQPSSLLYYLPSFLWISFVISITGMIINPSAIAIAYSMRLICSKENALERNGM